MFKFNIDKLNFTIRNLDNIETICLFGSTARGDNDSLSDIDFLFIVNDCSSEELIEYKKDLCSQLNVPYYWLSVYEKSKIELMRMTGAYFLWHLKIEGLIIYSKNGFIQNILNDLPEYSNAKNDLFDYKSICQDIRQSILIDDSTLEFELATLASLVRNTCITLSYLKGKYVFSRVKPVLECQEILGREFPFSVEAYNELYKFRIKKARENDNSLITLKPSVHLVKIWVEWTEKIIDLAINSLEMGVNK
jgi:predicted nucleotidyltransferase